LDLVKIVENVFFFSNTLLASLDHVEIVQLTSIKNYNLHFKSCPWYIFEEYQVIKKFKKTTTFVHR